MDFTLWTDASMTALQPINLLYLFLGTVFGLFIGALPGLGPLFGVSLMLPVTFYMEPVTAIIFLIAIHCACAYGDSWASILLNTPGGVGTVATGWDGYQLAVQGRSGYALGISAMSSLIGGLLGWIGLILLSPPLTKLALSMGPAEYSMTGLLALSLLSLAAAGETIKGMILGGLGLMISFVGQDPISGTSRFTFGSLYIEDGFRTVSVVLGLFAAAEALAMAQKSGKIAEIRKVTGQLTEGLLEVLRRPASVIRSGIAGILLGVMPALGLSTANIVAYLVEKRSSNEPEKFGKGHPAGVIAPEVAKNACVVGDLIPTFTLGIPGSSTTAILMAALMIHGVQIGPSMFQPGGIGYTVYAGVLLAQFAFFLLGLLSIRWVMRVVTIPYSILVPMILGLSFIGAYSDRNRLSDVIVTIAFGAVGYVLKKYGWPPACLVLGLVLGQIIESNFSRALLIGGGDYLVFLKRPISLTLFALTVLFLLSPYIGPLYRKLVTRQAEPLKNAG